MGRMKIAVVGPGAIGSTYAYMLSRTGHDVTVVARGRRLEALQREGAILLGSGERAAVSVCDALAPYLAWDLVLVTVRAPQVAAVLPALVASRAKTIMFMFNTFESIAPLSAAVGEARFAFGFPGGVFTLLQDGRIQPQIRRGSVSSDAAVADVLCSAGIPTAHEVDMQSWLRTHAAGVAPMMAVGVLSLARRGGISMREGWTHARALRAGLWAVDAMGSALRPSVFGLVRRLPLVVIAGLLWALSRTQMFRDLGALGADEPRMLLDMMSEAAPVHAAPLLAIRP